MCLNFFTRGVYTSHETLSTMTDVEVPASQYFFKVKGDEDLDLVAKDLESAFLEHGMETQVLNQVIDDNLASNRTLNFLLQGFMGLGLLVGIAALGVITARAVVERRRQIGALRAIGFQRGMIQATFLLESSFVAMLGIAIGTVLGLSLSYLVVGFIVEELGVSGAAFKIP